MAANKWFRTGPAFIANAVANILNCAVTSMAGPVGITIGQPYLRLRKITITNVSGAAVTFSLYIGATGGSTAGTQILGGTKSIPANDSKEFWVDTRMDSADFLTGVASSASALTIVIDGEVGISG